MLSSLRDLFVRKIICKGDNRRYLIRRGTRIGKNCSIMTLNFGSEPWLIEIGDHVTITSEVRLVTHDASSRLFRDHLPSSSPYGNRFGRIIIQDNCFIGVASVILPDVVIGPNGIVGAGSVVTKDVPPNTVVAGNPARYICTLDEYIEKYKQKMISISASDRDSLRRELTMRFWSEER